MRLLTTLDTILVRLIHWVVALVGLLVAIALVLGIFSRSVLNAPIFGLEELMLLGVMWFYMLGAALASREQSHLSADFVQVICDNPKHLRVAALFSTAVSLFIALMFVYWSWSLVSFGLQKGQSTPVFGIPWWVSQYSLLVASVLFVSYLMRDLMQQITGRAPDNLPTDVE